MANLIAIIRATRASHSAVDAMARAQRDMAHAEKTQAWNRMQVLRGYMSPRAAVTDNAICESDRLTAAKKYAAARKRYLAAQATLDSIPL